MSLYGNLLSSDQFQCSICLDIFNNPSSTPCGHSFCVTCINQYWDGAKVCQCPLCKRTFQKRPDLQINRTLREITEQFRSMSGGGAEGGGVAKEKKGAKGRQCAMPNELLDELTRKLPRPHASTQEMIQQRLVKIEDIRSSLVVERATMGSVCIFSALTAAIERAQAELMNVMQANRQTAANQADALIRQLEQEVEELRRRESALTQLSTTDDHLHGVKNFATVTAPLPTNDWSGVSISCDLGINAIYRSLAGEVEKFQEQLRGFTASSLETSPARPQPSECLDVTLDCNTAHPRLLLSDDMKSVWCGDRHQLLPDNVERFDRVVCVLGREAITSGRHYWEVQVGGKTDWDLGVARQSINRKGKIDVTPNNGYWFLSLRDKRKLHFFSQFSNSVLSSPINIGVFVDFDRGQVSFYNVDAKIHIYTFNDTFTECIFPFFSPCTNRSGKNDGPLVITPVDVSE
uniref:Bloodthirsty-related gene family, member 1 n=1 Tax=Hippocampus comes TaxID=109280 RepID=A0A3Q3DHY6_HIPCM